MRNALVTLCLFASAMLAGPSVQAQDEGKPVAAAANAKGGAKDAGTGSRRADPKEILLDDDTPVAAGQMTEEAAQAKRMFDAERWSEAALLLKRVVDGETKDDEGNKQIAQYHLAIALYRSQFYQASYAIFSEIADKPNHLKFNETLLWLSKLATQLPEPADVIERVGRYTTEQIARFNNPQQRDLYWQLNYLLGRYMYRNRNYDQAIDLFKKVDKDSKHHVQAQFFMGISHVQNRKSVPAIKSFQGILKALDDGAEGVEDETRMRDLAYLSMARTYYSASVRLDDNSVPTIIGMNISTAIKYWNRVDMASEYWLDALFEQSWAYFMAGDYPHALGNIHTIESPYFPNAFYPEADVLKAVISYTVCQYQDAVTIVARMRKKYEPIKKEFEAILGRFKGDDSDQKFFEFLQAVRAGKANLSPAMKPIIENAFSDRVLLRNLEYVRVLDEEEARFKKAPMAFRTSPVGTDVTDALQLARDLAIRNVGTLARERYQRYLDELNEHLRNGAKILIDVTTEERRTLDEEAYSGKMSKKEALVWGVVKPDEEHVLWPFNGEYWRDELGFYRQVVTSNCGK
jgi:tetratricopeptide (TPR) repeat protein